MLSYLESIGIAITPPCVCPRPSLLPPVSRLVSNFGRRDNSDDNAYIVVRLAMDMTRSYRPVIVGSDGLYNCRTSYLSRRYNDDSHYYYSGIPMEITRL